MAAPVPVEGEEGTELSCRAREQRTRRRRTHNGLQQLLSNYTNDAFVELAHSASFGRLREAYRANGLDAAKLASSFDSAEGTKRLEARTGPFAALGAFDNAATAMRQSPQALLESLRTATAAAGLAPEAVAAAAPSPEKPKKEKKKKGKDGDGDDDDTFVVLHRERRVAYRVPRATTYEWMWRQAKATPALTALLKPSTEPLISRALDAPPPGVDAVVRLCRDLRTELAGFAAHVTFCVRPSDAPPAAGSAVAVVGADFRPGAVREQLAVCGAADFARLHRAACPLAFEQRAMLRAFALLAPPTSNTRAKLEGVLKHAALADIAPSATAGGAAGGGAATAGGGGGQWAIGRSHAFLRDDALDSLQRALLAARWPHVVRLQSRARGRGARAVAAAAPERERAAEEARFEELVEEISAELRAEAATTAEGRPPPRRLRRPSGRRRRCRRLLSSRHSTPSPPSRAPSVPPPPPRRRPRPTRPRCGRPPRARRSARPRDLRMAIARGGRQRLPPRRRSTTAAAAGAARSRAVATEAEEEETQSARRHATVSGATLVFECAR